MCWYPGVCPYAWCNVESSTMMSQTVRRGRESIYVPGVAHSPVIWLVGLYKMDVTYCRTSEIWMEEA